VSCVCRGVVESAESASRADMNFLVDAHLPAALCRLLQDAGHDVIHTRDLPDGNKTKDKVLNEMSLRDQRVVITKDTDFYYSHILQGRPWKLLLARTGNLRTRDLAALFERNLSTIVTALDTHSLVELDQTRVQPVV
jgi:predicted nuclease of predicted toxin-antitoxin system